MKELQKISDFTKHDVLGGDGLNEKVTVDPEFESLIPPLTPDEYKQLEANCRKDGILDSLKVWHGILIDGHNRLRISKEWDLNYETCEIDLPNREAALLWIINHQLGERNLILYDRVKLEDKKKEILSEQAQKNKGGDRKSEEFQKSKDKKSCPLIQRDEKRKNSTDYKIAKAAGTSEDTVRKVRAIEKEGNQKIIDDVRSGDKTINQAWLEIKKKERKNLAIGARERLEEAEQRHDEFTEQKTVSIEAIKQDRKDSAEIAEAKAREIQNALKKILFIGAVTNGGDMDFSEVKKNLSETSCLRLMSDINNAISILSKIKEWLK